MKEGETEKEGESGRGRRREKEKKERKRGKQRRREGRDAVFIKCGFISLQFCEKKEFTDSKNFSF